MGMVAAKVSDQSRMWAGLSYFGLFLGWPLALFPLFDRRDAFALFHAKCAMVVALQFLALLALYMAAFAFAFAAFFVTCGLSHLVMVPFLMVAWIVLMFPAIPAAHGMILALGGELRAPFGTFGLGERLFRGLTTSAEAR